ncbi:MAG: hypothetical protein D0433_04665 [Candidatus Thermochlorobacter aerophilum]|jgi:hypothetical protein|uniref:Outer membrane protein beta-barrel domain-containing protein n=1 Tax=Candidatus Thermochlorobacter aerophilus TaxID=1868324 RepID=A0A395M1V7_9BACT|nr:MAG: hypothetical protein D0433_06520 [Candidatus Thermochlorobacter aerophilum]RFM24692.1 MAG: hypothetical protein D0433_04665 [Candidatus Thermochlorobacter aerophilum]
MTYKQTKNLLLLVLFFCLGYAIPQAEAQSLFLRKGMIAGAGLGLDGFGGLPIVGQLEFGVGPKIGIGRFGVGALAGIYFNPGATAVMVGGQGNYHFDIPTVPELDLYAGLNLLIGFAGSRFGGSSTGVGLGLNVGARYFFTPLVAGFLRLGWGLSIATIGIDFAM